MENPSVEWLSFSSPKEHACPKAWGKNYLEMLMKYSMTSLVFASIVLLAWEGKNEYPSHMTLLHQQKLCRNNSADEDFVGLAFIIQRNPTDSRKTPPGSWAISRADILKILCPCAHTSTLPQLPAIFILWAIPKPALAILTCSYCKVTHHPLSAPFDNLHIFLHKFFTHF